VGISSPLGPVYLYEKSPESADPMLRVADPSSSLSG